MNKSTVIPQKKRGPAPTGKGKPIVVRLHSDILEPLDQFISDNEKDLSRPEAIRLILKERLVDI